jgi:hypothetical protein
MLGWLVSLGLGAWAVPAGPPPQGPGAPERILVVGQRYQNVVFEGAPWQPGRSWIEGRGKGNALYADLGLGAGEFEVRAKLSIEGGEGAEPAILLGERRVELAEKIVPRERTVELLLARAAGRLTLKVDGQAASDEEAPAGALGRFGIAPGKALVRVFQLSLAGDLEPLPDRALPPGFQGAVDAAIERGVAFLLARQLRDGSWQNATASFADGQTALATYALLRSGLTREHPAIARALAHLAEVRPTETYPAGLMLMAFEATGDPAWRAPMRAVAADLVAWQQAAGWSYAPEARGGAVYRDAVPATDLSNTQYAVLGLRAADHAGVDVPPEAWARALASTLTLQESARDLEIPRRDGKTGTERIQAAGFRYRADREVTASMTAAGCAILQVCRTALARRIKAQSAAEAARGIELGKAWLDAHWNLEENVGSLEPQNYFYYLYGLERVGTLLDTETFGEHAWYPEIAETLLRRQEKDGSWVVGGYASSPWREIPAEHDTCFAILFLKRASRPTVRTGAPVREHERDPAAPVTLAASGRTEVLLWIAGFGDAVLARAGGVRVASVEYLAGTQVLARIEGDPSKPWSREDFLVRHVFAEPGAVPVRARVRLAGPDEAIESVPRSVASDGTLEPWMVPAAARWKRNVLATLGVAATASSLNAAGQEPEKALDGLESTLWLCREADAEPALVLEWPKPVVADALVLGGPCSRRADLGKYDRIRRVRVSLDKRKEPIEVAAPRSEIEPIVVPLPKGAQVRRIEIRIVEREPGGEWKGRVGFTEVALERSR